MPFTASLGQDRAASANALCGPLIKGGTWDATSWSARSRYCRSCSHRFKNRPSCSVDFMSISDTDPLTIDLANALVYIAEQDPDWREFGGVIYEADYAYSQMNARLPKPKKVVEDFIESCVDREVDKEFWKRWNHVGVEGFEGKPALRVTWLQPEVKGAVEKIMKNIVEPATLGGVRLRHFYAAMAILNEVASTSDCETMDVVTEILLDACRAALTAGCSLEIA